MVLSKNPIKFVMHTTHTGTRTPKEHYSHHVPPNASIITSSPSTNHLPGFKNQLLMPTNSSPKSSNSSYST